MPVWIAVCSVLFYRHVPGTYSYSATERGQKASFGRGCRGGPGGSVLSGERVQMSTGTLVVERRLT